jgi:hypothetical protein
VETLKWTMGKRTSPVEASITGSQAWLMPEPERRRRDAYLRPFRPSSLLLYVLAIACLAASNRKAPAAISLTRGALTMLAVFLAAMLPALAVFPAFHWVADGIVAWCASIYAAIALTIAAGWRAGRSLLADRVRDSPTRSAS